MNGLVDTLILTPGNLGTGYKLTLLKHKDADTLTIVNMVKDHISETKVTSINTSVGDYT